MAEQPAGDRLKDLFADASDLPIDGREALLAARCGTDGQLRQAVESLLSAHDEAGRFLAGAVRATPPDDVPAGQLIGRYKLLQNIGEGGFGTVFMAEQLYPVRRRVALKIIKPGMDSRQVIARFEAERQALAMMDHPNIAKVLDAGATESGRPYFVMDLVDGVPITRYCDEQQLDPRQRLELFIEICNGLQHAHQKGIIHRDIKPSNLLVITCDGRPVPKIIDFGIAKALYQKLTEETMFTQFGAAVGTLEYMSPEQTQRDAAGTDTRSDIYSLGVVLYELLTGSTPLESRTLRNADFAEVLRMIREAEPPRPSTRIGDSGVALAAISAHRKVDPRELGRLVYGDLDWIVMKALEKDRARRYATASDLARDIQRYLNDEPVEARPPSTSYRFQKLVRRNKIAFFAASAIIAALILGLGVSTVLFLREKDARLRAVVAERQQIKLREQAQRAQATESELRLLAQANEKKLQAEATKSRQVAQFLKEMFNAPSPWASAGRDTTVLREIMDRAAAHIGADLADQPELEGELRSVLGMTYWSIAEHPKSEAMLRRAIELFRQSRAEVDLPLAEALRGLGQELRDTSRPAEAEAALREALAIQQKLLGGDHAEVARTLRDLGLVLLAVNKQPEAERVEREALALRRKLHSGDHADVADSLHRLACVLTDDQEAEALMRDAVAMQRRLYGDTPNLHLAKTLLTLAVILQHEGKLPEAERTARESLDVTRNVTGEWPVDSLYRLMVILNRQGKNQALKELFEEIPIPETGRPSSRASLYSAWAKILRDEGKLAEAENLDRKAASIRQLDNEKPAIIPPAK
jgi:serine/threonine protein kinase